MERRGWPPHTVETLPWSQQFRGGTREDRELDTVHTSVPPNIATLNYPPPLPITVTSEHALLAVAQADADAEGQSSALSRFMVRSESVASSKIERVSASAEDFARALGGSRANTSALSMVAASTALVTLIDSVGARGAFTIGDITGAHHALMFDDPDEAPYAGKVRDMQNWIGGSDHSPRDALYVPPAPARVQALMDDLIIYLNRDDVPVMVQAAIAHAQFESIHAYTDGNGRIGRALVSASLRRRGVARHAVVPLASGLLAKRDDYFAALTTYRAGDPAPIIDIFARSARAAAVCARDSIARLAAIPGEWELAIKPRAGSAAAVLIPAFFDNPVMNAEEVIALTGGSETRAYRAIDQLVGEGFISELTGRKRDRVWAASEVLAELNDLDRRINQEMSRRG